MKHAQNKLKVSGALVEVLSRHKYTYYDVKSNLIVLRLTFLQRDETIQSVATWFKDKGTADLLLGELREQLRMNGLPPLRDHSDSAQDAQRAFGFKMFGRKAT